MLMINAKAMHSREFLEKMFCNIVVALSQGSSATLKISLALSAARQVQHWIRTANRFGNYFVLE
jgi:hypothetical protein